MRPRRALLAAGAVAAAVAWAGAAWWLWGTTVPDGLRLAQPDVHRLFTQRALDRAERFDGVLRALTLGSIAVILLTLWLYARRGARLARESAAGPVGTGMLLGMLGLGILWLTQLPFGLGALWWERRYGVARDGYLEWLLDSWFALGGEFLFICLALLVVMGLGRLLRRTWWIAAAPAFTLLALLFTFAQPYLTPSVHRSRDPVIRREARDLARIEGVAPIPVDVQKVSTSTTSPNAMATGLGPSRRVVLWDTIVEFPRREVRVVLGHEIAHHARRHLWRGLGWYALFAPLGTLVIALAVRRRGGMGEPAAVPLALFVLVASQLLALPLDAAFSRRLEAEADWVALNATRDPAGAKALFRDFTTRALADPSPPRWSSLLLDGHPTIAERIAMTDAWRVRNSR